MGKVKDPEIRALKTVLDVLSELEPSAQDRIMQYVASWLDDQLGSSEDLGIQSVDVDGPS